MNLEKMILTGALLAVPLYLMKSANAAAGAPTSSTPPVSSNPNRSAFEYLRSLIDKLPLISEQPPLNATQQHSMQAPLPGSTEPAGVTLPDPYFTNPANMSPPGGGGVINHGGAPADFNADKWLPIKGYDFIPHKWAPDDLPDGYYYLGMTEARDAAVYGPPLDQGPREAADLWVHPIDPKDVAAAVAGTPKPQKNG